MTQYKARKLSRILNDELTSFNVRAARMDDGTWAICYAEQWRRSRVLFSTEQQVLAFMNAIGVPAMCSVAGCWQKALWRTRRTAIGGTAFYYLCRDHEYMHRS
jgi:hypothetical protein